MSDRTTDPMRQRYRTLEEKFLNNIRTDLQTGCVNWLRGKSFDGYGNMRTPRGKQIKVHRYAWERVNGPIPAGILVRHRCDNPSCCNVEHLELGTHLDNSNDRVERGRSAYQKGEANGFSKIGDDDVRAIRMLSGMGIKSEVLGKFFDISGRQIRDIRAYRVWRHVK